MSFTNELPAIPDNTQCGAYPERPLQVWIPQGAYFEGNKLIYRTAGKFMPGFLEIVFPELDRGKKYEMQRLIKQGGFWLTRN